MLRPILSLILTSVVLLSSAQELESFYSDSGKSGFKDKAGNIVIQPIFDSAYPFSEGLSGVKQNGRWGFVNVRGEMVVPTVFEDIRSFREGLAPVMQNGKWGYIDKSGKWVLQPVYDFHSPFYDGVADTKLNGKWGFIDKKGNFYNSGEEARKAVREASFSLPFSEYLTTRKISPNYHHPSEQELAAMVEAEVMEWQKKGEFEPTSEWQKRVTEQSRAAKVREVSERIVADSNKKLEQAKADYRKAYEAAAAEYCAHRTERFANQVMELKPYDADNQTYLISTADYGDILLPVPLSEAPAFKSNWEANKKTVKATFVPNGNDVALQSVAFGKYVYDSNTRASYAQVDIDYNFRPIDVSSLNLKLSDMAAETPAATTTAVVAPRRVEPERKSIETGNGMSDVDRNIPSTGRTASHTFAMVIANTNYRHASKVENAGNDGRVFTNYLKQTLGLPDDNITTLYDATLGDIAAGISHLQDIGRAYKNEPFGVIVYYVGHGLPDEVNRESYILPIDASPRNTRVCYPLKDLYIELANLGAESVTVMIDACFSGANHGDGMLVSQAMGVAIKPKTQTPSGNMVVLSAAQGDETAFPYDGQNHGLFTYWLLKKLQDTGGNVTLGELADYVTDNVSKTSVLKNHKSQTPAVAISPAIQDTWRELPLVK